MTNSTRWQPDRSGDRQARTRPSLALALRRGLAARCPVCGQAALFAGYLRVRTACPNCGELLGRIHADDAPPYFTILIVAHIVVPGMLLLERAATPPLWVHAIIWLPLTLGLTLALLRPIKGAILGAMLALGVPAVEDEPA